MILTFFISSEFSQTFTAYIPVRMKFNNTFPSISQELIKVTKHLILNKPLKTPIKWLQRMQQKIEIFNFC